jgi:hypothetical protein
VKPNIEFMGFIGTTEVMAQEETISVRPYRTESNWGNTDPGFHPGLLSPSPSGRNETAGFIDPWVGIAGGGL